jgi:hypothetical protein
MLLALFLSVTVAQTIIVPPNKHLQLYRSVFQGFIYPYVITSTLEDNLFQLTFTRLDQSEVLFQPKQITTSMLELNYEMLP